MSNHWVYVIKSEVDKRLYVGISQNPAKRLKSHNKGDTKSTKGFRPWKLVYTKFVGGRIKARKEEKRLKSGYGKEWLKSQFKK